MATKITVTDPLCTALQEFDNSLTPSLKTELLLLKASPDATAVITFTAEIDRRNAKRRSRGVASRLFGVLESVRQFTSIIDTFVQAHPEIAALVWGSVKITILAVSNFASYFDKLSEWFMRLGNTCPRFSEYQLLFADYPKLQAALCRFYATVIRFCKHALEATQRSGIAHAAKSFFRPFENEFGTFETELRMQSNEVKEEIGFAAETAAYRERQLQLMHRKASSRFWQRATAEADEAKSWRQQAEERALKKRKRLALDALSTYDEFAALKEARKKRHGTTCLWLSKTDGYRAWLNDPQSSLFWCSGILGSGKTVLTAAVVDDILCSRSKDDIVTYFFCRYNDDQSLKARIILGSLVRQALESCIISTDIEARLADLYQHPMTEVDDLAPLFHEITASSKRHFIIIDGVDECAKSERNALLDVLERACSSSSSNLKLFIAARDSIDRDLRTTFKTLQHESLKNDGVQLDIQTYIEDTLRQKFEKDQLVLDDIELLFEIRDVLLKGADGMFLWVYFQIEDICEQVTDGGIRKVMSDLPRDLNETYERILAKIKQQGNSTLAAQIFQWVSTVKRPLTLDEIREAIGIEPHQQYIKQERLLHHNVGQIAASCGNLIILDEEEATIRFAHHSIKDFLHAFTNPLLHEFRISQSAVNFHVGEICVTYLNFNDFKTQLIKPAEPIRIEVEDMLTTSLASNSSSSHSNFAKSIFKLEKFRRSRSAQRFDLSTLGDDTPTRTLLSNYAFLPYARQHWLAHSATFTPDTPATWSLWRALLDSENFVAEKPWTLSEWTNRSRKIPGWIVANDHYALLTYWLSSGPPPVERVYPSVAIGPQLNELICEQRKGNISFRDIQSLIELALAASTRRGGLELATELATMGAFQVEPWELDCQALRTAAADGHLEIVEFLLDANVNKHSQNIDGDTAAHLAAANGHSKICLLLMNRGAWSQQQNLYGFTALDIAYRSCDMKSVVFPIVADQISRSLLSTHDAEKYLIDHQSSLGYS